MKKLLLIIAMALFFSRSFSQQSDPAPTLPKQDYLKKSKNQKTTAWILLAGGAALVVTGAIISKAEVADLPAGSHPLEEIGPIKVGVLAAGTLTMLVSIPFFIASGKNKRKAMSLSFNAIRIPQIKSMMVYRSTPVVSITISL